MKLEKHVTRPTQTANNPRDLGIGSAMLGDWETGKDKTLVDVDQRLAGSSDIGQFVDSSVAMEQCDGLEDGTTVPGRGHRMDNVVPASASPVMMASSSCHVWAHPVRRLLWSDRWRCGRRMMQSDELAPRAKGRPLFPLTRELQLCHPIPGESHLPWWCPHSTQLSASNAARCLVVVVIAFAGPVGEWLRWKLAETN